MRSLFLGFLALVAGLIGNPAPGQAQSLHPVDMDGVTLNLVVPEGYCVLDDSDPEQAALRALYDPYENSRQRPVLFFIACGLLTAPDTAPFVLQTGTEDIGLYIYDDVWTELLQGRHAVRVLYIDFIEEIYGGAPIGFLRNDLKARFEASNDPMKSAMLVYETDLGGADRTALYQILRIEAFHDGEKSLFGGALGDTLVRQRVVQAVLLRRIGDEGELEPMRDEIEDLMDELLDANPE